ncbi:hypothetical protein [Stenotrophomonas maltophilia]|uniref:hypothetical protein n=1 Tax=Stenotrophomonas maltophilia TaxID=40324 RepID=UPI0012AF66EF|nr:hypothetical protein [Stenotrophomonas maltophilia]QGM05643.1 hypothetical protein FEO88_12420 [Stenotrophomonas maltophilia]
MQWDVALLLALAGISASTGRVLPLLARRNALTLRLLVALMLTGALVEAAVFALWPLMAWVVADLAQPFIAPGVPALPSSIGFTWTPSLILPLLLAAILAFPLLGHLLHALVLIVAGARMITPLASASGLGWWDAALCMAMAVIWLELIVELLRRGIARAAAGTRSLGATA